MLARYDGLQRSAAGACRNGRSTAPRMPVPSGTRLRSLGRSGDDRRIWGVTGSVDLMLPTRSPLTPARNSPILTDMPRMNSHGGNSRAAISRADPGRDGPARQLGPDHCCSAPSWRYTGHRRSDDDGNPTPKTNPSTVTPRCESPLADRPVEKSVPGQMGWGRSV